MTGGCGGSVLVKGSDLVRVFTIARREICEAAAALEIGALAGDCSTEFANRSTPIAARAVGLLTGLIQPRAKPES